MGVALSETEAVRPAKKQGEDALPATIGGVVVRKAVERISKILDPINDLKSLGKRTYVSTGPIVKYVLTDRSNVLGWCRVYMEFSGHFGMPLREGAINPEC